MFRGNFLEVFICKRFKILQPLEKSKTLNTKNYKIKKTCKKQKYMCKKWVLITKKNAKSFEKYIKTIFLQIFEVHNWKNSKYHDWLNKFQKPKSRKNLKTFKKKTVFIKNDGYKVRLYYNVSFYTCVCKR
jgi:hypothetical protein